MSVRTAYPSTDRPAHAERTFRYRDSVYFQDGQWFAGLLGAVLYLILAAALDAAGHVENLSIVIPVTLGAFLLGLLMSYSRFDGFFALSHSMFVGLAWILFMMASAVPEADITPFLDNGIAELQARVYFVLLRLLDWLDAAVSGAASADNYVFVFEISFLMWWLAYLGAWAIFRHGYTWRAIIPAGVVLLINTYYAPRSTIGFLACFVMVALVLLIRTNLAEQQLRWREQRVYFNQDIVWDFLRNGALFSLIVVVLAWGLPGLGRNPQVRELLSPFNSGWEDTAQSVQRLYQGLNRQPQEMAANFGNSLALGGERIVGDSPVFQIQASQGRYWRAVVFDTFNGRQWQNTAGDARSYAAGEIVPVASWRARQAISQTINVLAPIGDVLVGAADIAQADLGLKAQVRPLAGATPIPAAAAQAGSLPVEFTMVHANRDLGPGDRYTFVSAATDASVHDLENASVAYPPEVIDRFVQIPPDFSPRVAELARRLTDGKDTAYAKAKAIETYLRTIPYNDAIPPPPADSDPIEYFLFDLQEGYCDYYASAMAMMLRSQGIPARAVSGYAEGILDEEGGGYFVTERDAHTWVEVFFPEYGWIEFEPTAGESPLERRLTDEEVSVTSQQEQQPDSPLAAPPQSPDRAGEELPPQFTGEELLQQPGGGAGSFLPWWAWVLGLLLVLPIGGFFIWRARNNGPAAFTTELPVLLYERMQRWAQRLNLGPATGQTPYEHARQLAGALPETRIYVGNITDSYVRLRFSRHSAEAGAATESAQDPSLLQSWRQLEPLLWKAWLQKLRSRFTSRGREHYALVDEPEE